MTSPQQVSNLGIVDTEGQEHLHHNAESATSGGKADHGVVVFTDAEMAAMPKVYSHRHVEALTSENDRLRSLLAELLRHDERGNGPWTMGMRARVREAAHIDG